ncbi:MAG: hypothetical protein P4L45_02205 [Ignavibacteriaceae bacterium]|nr:hypothetical protein [Ignavibacteriaceae bacterium]
MKWYNYIACLFAGIFLANFAPHFIEGITGQSFPTPFANPPGKGLSSPTVNVLWGLLNLVISYLLFRASRISNKNIWSVIIFFIGILLMSLMCSVVFAGVHN